MVEKKQQQSILGDKYTLTIKIISDTYPEHFWKTFKHCGSNVVRFLFIVIIVM